MRKGIAAVRRRVREKERGASLVELALILPVLAILVFGTVDLVRAYRLNIRLEGAAREGAALAQIDPNDIDCPGDHNDVRDRVANEDPDLTSEDAYSVRTYYDEGSGFVEYGTGLCFTDGDAAVVEPGDRVLLEVSADFKVLTPLVQNLTGEVIAMTSAAEVEVQG